jgi:tripartite ATP-independent transporter DctM subunit
MFITIILLALCVLLVLGTPIGVGMAVVAVAVMWYVAGPDLFIIFIQRLYAGTTSFPLLAIPFFILAGNLMNVGGMTHRIFNVAHVMVGRIRGGLGHVNVLASVLFSGMSGSAVADAAGLGVVEIKAMKEAGYTPRFAATLTAVSSTIGPIIPPSIPFVIYGSLANVSVGALFLAGIVPGLLMAIGLMIVVALVAKRQNLPIGAPRPPLAQTMAIIGRAMPALIMPPLILASIFSGVATPTEASVIAALYALLLGTLWYRELPLAMIPSILWETGRQTAQVMFIIAVAEPFGWVMIQQQIPNAALAALFSIAEQPWLILLIINAVLLVLGTALEGIAILIIAFPILLPIIVKIGVDPVHFGVVIVLNLMIGLVTPPVGLCLYVVSSIARVPLAEISKELWPYLIALICVLGIVTYIPELSLWLPRSLGYGVIK